MHDRKLHRILCVEDEPDIREVIKLALEAIGGFQVELCGSGLEALAKAPDFSPDLILLDVMMPDMSGPSTLEALRELPQFSATPIVFITAKTQGEEIVRYRELGAIDVITKPFNAMTLSEKVNAIWNSSSS